MKETSMDDNAILDLFRERSEDAIVQVQIKYGNYCRSIAYGFLPRRIPRNV